MPGADVRGRGSTPLGCQRVWGFPGFEDGTKPNPAARITKNREHARKRFVKPSEFGQESFSRQFDFG